MIALIIIFVLLGCLFAIAIPSDAEIEEEIREAKEWEAFENISNSKEIRAFHAACVEAMGGNAELTTIRYGLGNEGMILMYNGKEVSPGEYHLLQKNGVGLIPNAHIIAPIKTIDTHEPSCKCQYCGCTNDHIYGTCDFCGAPLEG